MKPTRSLRFPPFVLDTANASLRRGAKVVRLTPKAFAVLRCLVERSGQLVTKDALLEAVWPSTAVGDAVLKVCIREIRRALGDQAHAPRFIATVHTLGYRFIAPVLAADNRLDAEPSPPTSRPRDLPI